LDTQWIVFVIILISNAIIAAMIAILLGRKHSAPGRNAMRWMLAGLAVWAFCYAMITLAPSLEAKKFWLKMENIGILTVPALWLIFTVQYAQVDRWLNRYTGALLFVIPLVSLILLFSNAWFHYFIHQSIRFLKAADPWSLNVDPGIWLPPFKLTCLI